MKDPKSTRLREGDEVLAVLQGSTKEAAVLFSNRGTAYVLKLNDVPPSTGYGEPVQKVFRFGDGERVVGALSLDPRLTPEKNVLLLAATRRGLVLRFSLDPFREVTTRAGRRFAKPAKGDEIASSSFATRRISLPSRRRRAARSCSRRTRCPCSRDRAKASSASSSRRTTASWARRCSETTRDGRPSRS